MKPRKGRLANREKLDTKSPTKRSVKTISIKEMTNSKKSNGSSDEDSDEDNDGSDSSDSDEFEAMTTEVLNELALMHAPSHPHIVTIREFFTEQNGAVIHVVDLLKGQELEDAVTEQPNGRFPEPVAKDSASTS